MACWHFKYDLRAVESSGYRGKLPTHWVSGTVSSHHSAAPDDFRIEDENVPVFDELAELAREPVLRPIIEDLATHARI